MGGLQETAPSMLENTGYQSYTWARGLSLPSHLPTLKYKTAEGTFVKMGDNKNSPKVEGKIWVVQERLT